MQSPLAHAQAQEELLTATGDDAEVEVVESKQTPSGNVEISLRVVKKKKKKQKQQEEGAAGEQGLRKAHTHTALEEAEADTAGLYAELAGLAGGADPRLRQRRARQRMLVAQTTAAEASRSQKPSPLPLPLDPTPSYLSLKTHVPDFNNTSDVFQ